MEINVTVKRVRVMRATDDQPTDHAVVVKGSRWPRLVLSSSYWFTCNYTIAPAG